MYLVTFYILLFSSWFLFSSLRSRAVINYTLNVSVKKLIVRLHLVLLPPFLLLPFLRLLLLLLFLLLFSDVASVQHLLRTKTANRHTSHVSGEHSRAFIS